MDYKDLTLEEQFAWDKCDNEHGFDRTKERSCYKCRFMISSLERFLRLAIKRMEGEKVSLEKETKRG